MRNVIEYQEKDSGPVQVELKSKGTRNFARDEEFSQFACEVVGLRKDLVGINEAFSKGCCKTQLLGVSEELAELRRNVAQLNKLMIMLLESRGHGMPVPNPFSPPCGSPTGLGRQWNYHNTRSMSPNTTIGGVQNDTYCI